MPIYESMSSTESIHRALLEQGEDEVAIAELVPTLARLGEWHAPVPDSADTRRLVQSLAVWLPVPRYTSEVRATLQQQSERSGWLWQMGRFMNVARAQVGLMRISFWLTSALIVALGALALLSGLSQDQAYILRALGPLLAVLSVGSVMRSSQLGVLQLELACRVSPVQLVLARLVVVLGYDIVLGLGLTVLLWPAQINSGPTSLGLWALTLHWLAPLLLVAGAALLLSLKVHPAAAASAAYAGWLLVLGLSLLEGKQGAIARLLAQGETGMLALGACLLLAAVLSARRTATILLPRN